MCDREERKRKERERERERRPLLYYSDRQQVILNAFNEKAIVFPKAQTAL